MKKFKRPLPVLVAAFSAFVLAAVGLNGSVGETADDGVHILLVGHGIPAKDFPKDKLREFFQLGTEHHSHGRGHEDQACDDGHEHDKGALRYAELERQIRAWPRTRENDPYKYGTESIAEHLRNQTGGPVWVAYNEFCDPTIGLMIDKAVANGAKRIVAVSTMLVPGGGHSESDIPRCLEEARKEHPGVEITYAWPYDVEKIATLLSAQIQTTAAD